MDQDKSHIKVEMALSFQKGNEKALSFFYHEFYPALAHYSFQLTQSRPIAEEIASEAFVKVWRMHYKLDSYAGIKAYLYRIVHRDSIKAVSSEQKRTKTYRNLQPETTTDTPYDNLIRTEVYRLIHTALKNLSPAKRSVLIKYYLEGKTTGQIAKELNLHPSTIRTQKTQGFDDLKNAIVKSIVLFFYFCSKIF